MVPMINVVFLLLVFFLISAQLTPPEPFEIALPEATTAERAAEGRDVLYVGADGGLAYRAARGADAVALVAAEARDGPLLVRADRAVPGAEIARLLARLAAAGIARVDLVATGG
ncbi:biopolymer transporter ExbD [Rhodovulum sp. ES.010]|uniref:biopolymer transporter ExbD n=1 Tax=Rhodovulum sp. ES.010 TaxID=1882821 RepID=UPI00352DA2D5